ncbi:hypothetical protein J31TS4_27350 [Paenibacillus sp. J31TS4]|nr:hypothetical protein J31TS4_27350 [Paenibacillus sp. J31TS4]
MTVVLSFVLPALLVLFADNQHLLTWLQLDFFDMVTHTHSVSLPYSLDKAILCGQLRKEWTNRHGGISYSAGPPLPG